jgi:hypothetical protein
VNELSINVLEPSGLTFRILIRARPTVVNAVLLCLTSLRKVIRQVSGIPKLVGVPDTVPDLQLEERHVDQIATNWGRNAKTLTLFPSAVLPAERSRHLL